jgi:hypothetical protein
MSGGGGMMGGVIDPETLYTKQNCIGIHPRITVRPQTTTDWTQAVAVLEKSTKGMTMPEVTGMA